MLNHPVEMPVYARFPLRMVRGEGCYVWGEDGRRFLDFYGGHAVALTGHSHPRVVAAIEQQARSLLFYSNVVGMSVRDRFFDTLASLTPQELHNIFLVNTGAEANEQAVALARRATGRANVVTLEGSFHGRTLATLVLSGIKRYRQLAEQSEAGQALAHYSRICPFDDVETLATLCDEQTAAVLLEPVQGLAGARALSPAFLQRARQICDATGAALIFDEIQTGCGRTGAFTTAQRLHILPDAITLAKGLAAGLPMSAVLANDWLATDLTVGDLGTTFGAGPLACAAATANLAIVRDEQLPAAALRSEQSLRSALSNQKGLTRICGMGLLLGLVLDRPARPVQQALFEHGVLVGTASEPHTLRLLPPLTIVQADIDLFLNTLREVLS